MTERTIKTRLELEIAGFRQGMQDARKESEKTAYQFDKDGKKIEQSSGKLVRHAQLNKTSWTAAGTAVAAFGAAGLLAITQATKAAIDWETAWTGVVKTVNGTADQMAELEGQLREMARTLPATHSEIAAVAEAAGQLGVRTEDVAGFTRVMIDLGNTTNLSADEAATSIAQLMNVMQSAPGDVDNLGAAIVALGNNGASTERDIVQMAQRIGASGKLIGLSEGDVLGLANALSSVGIDAEAGGSAVSNIMIDIAKAANTGSKELTTWAQVAGESVDEFRDSWKSDPAGALTDIIEGLGRMNAAGEDVFSTLDDLGQSDVRVTRALLSMATSGDLLADSLKLGNQALKDNTALVAEAEKRYDTTASKIEVARNSLNDAAITIGSLLLPVLGKLADGVSSVADSFARLPAPVQGAIGGLAGVASVLLVIGGGLLILLPRLSATVASFEALQTRAPLAAKALTAVGKTAGPLALALAAFTAITAASDAFSAKWTGVVKSASETTAALLAMGDSADSLTGIFDFKDSTFGWTGQINDLADAAHRISDPSLLDRFSDFRGSVDGILGKGETSRTLAINQIDQLGNALATLVSSGNADLAKKKFDALAKQWEAGGGNVKTLTKLMPEYTDALADVDNQNTLTTESTKKQAAATQESAEAAEAAAKALQDYLAAVSGADSSFINLADAYQSVIDKNNEWAQATADATKSSKDSLDDYYDGATVSIKDYIKQLQKQTDAQNDWEDNLTGLADRANKLKSPTNQDNVKAMLEELSTQPENAPLVQALSGASDKQLAKIAKLWAKGGTAASTEFANSFENKLNPVITPTVDTVTPKSDYFAMLNQMRKNSKVVIDFSTTVNGVPYKNGQAPPSFFTVTPTSGGGGGGGPAPLKRSQGGPVFGAGTSTSDSIPALLSDQEYVQTARAHNFWGTAAMDAINRRDVGAVMAAIATRGYRDGGVVSRQSMPQIVTVPVSASHTASAPVTIQHATFASPGDAGMAALDRLNRKSGGR